MPKEGVDHFTLLIGWILIADGLILANKHELHMEITDTCPVCGLELGKAQRGWVFCTARRMSWCRHDIARRKGGDCGGIGYSLRLVNLVKAQERDRSRHAMLILESKQLMEQREVTFTHVRRSRQRDVFL